MTRTQIYNLAWLIVWLIGLVLSLIGAIKAGGPFFWIFVFGSLCLSIILFLDKEDGESLKELLVRTLKNK